MSPTKWIINFSAIPRSLRDSLSSATLPVYRSISALVHYSPSKSRQDERREECTILTRAATIQPWSFLQSLE